MSFMFLLWRVLPIPTAVRWLLVRAAHTRYLVAACALVFDAQGRLLLQRHTYRRRYAWGLPGGWLHGAEQAGDGLTREINEKTGLRAEVGPLVRAVTGGSHRKVELIYSVRVTGSFRSSPEVSEAAYFGFDELPTAIAPDTLAMITWAFANRSAFLHNDDPGT